LPTDELVRAGDRDQPDPPRFRARGFDPAATDASLEGLTFHDLRHAYGSRLASKGLTARAIADAMGHRRTATTEIYIQRFNGPQADDKVREAMAG
jgi:integrase